jgi:hypothetical protein
MANLIMRYEIEVTAHYTTNDVDDAENREEAKEKAINEFYDNSHRASIDDTRVVDEWFECLDCGDEHIEDDHECEDEDELSDDY